MKDNPCKILSNQELADGYYRLVFEKPFTSFQPGQFCMVKVPHLKESLLRHPFSLCQESDEKAEIIYKVVGPTTHAMARLKPGSTFWVLGPLGKGLDCSDYLQVIGIAGGYGIAPMLGLGNHLKESSIDYQVYYGARSEADLLLREDFASREISVHVSTEDGSCGFVGRVTDFLKKQKKEVSGEGTLWFVCGPHGLLQAAAKLASSWKVDCYTSLEETMGCGIGVCLGCVVKTNEGHYVRSCVEGPVMDSRLITWQKN